MRKLFVLGLLALGFLNSAIATPDEGMWLPLYLKKLNEADMKKLGLKLSADQIYNTSEPSLKDAIVRLNGGSCTAELVSSQGLLFTNHHCAYGAIWKAIGSKLIDKESYKEKGFWTNELKEEIGGLNMSAGILDKIENITDKIYPRLEKISDEAKRQQAKEMIMDSLNKALNTGRFVNVQVKEMFDGNQFYTFHYTVYRDVRLVASPPESIGKFGGDTDNWMWPRHTGDFAILRVYAGPNNEPAEYSEDNKPYKPKKFLPISIKRKQEGDFSMIMGFPGSTERYLTSHELTTKLKHVNPAAVKSREVTLDVMEKWMKADGNLETELKSLRAQIANYYKLWMGQIRANRQYDLIGLQAQEEEKFMQWVNADAKRKERFGTILADMQKSERYLQAIEPGQNYYFNGIFFLSTTLRYGLGYSRMMRSHMMTEELMDSLKKTMPKAEYNALADSNEAKEQKMIAGVKSSTEAFFSAEDYPHIKPYEMEILKELMLLYYHDVNSSMHPAFLAEAAVYQGLPVDEAIRAYMDDAWSNSIVGSKESALKFLAKPKFSKLAEDKWVNMIDEIIANYGRSFPPINQSVALQIGKSRRLYLEALMAWKQDKAFYPDANSTLRLTYGTVLPYEPRDGVFYTYRTTHEGILEKNDPNDDEFENSPRLLDLIRKKDFGRYGPDGTLDVCFLTNHDITGGNSGSPVIDGEGNLIGIAFDGNWESATGDFQVMPQYNRTISVDARYVLFVIDKFAGCQRLIDELEVKS